MHHPSNLKFYSGLGGLILLPALGAGIGILLTRALGNNEILGLGYMELGLAVSLVIALPRFIHLQLARLKYQMGEQKSKSSHRERIRAINQELERKKQEELLSLIQACVEKAASDQVKIPVCLIKAEEYLAKALHDFAENAYSPFWLNIENCLVELAAFNQYTSEVLQSWHEFERCNRQLRVANPIRFPVMMQQGDNVGLCRRTAERFRETIRKAQKEFKFAIIAENKRTNAIWEEGLLPLNDAIGSLEQKITASITELTQMVAAISNLNRTLEGVNEGTDYSQYGTIAPETDDLKKQFSATRLTLLAAAKNTEKAWLALDNMQKGNKMAVENLLDSLAIENL